MWEWVGLFILKILMGASFHLILNNKKKKMRVFDELNLETQTEILVSCVRYAKGEIAEFNLPPTTDVKELALQYDTMYFLEPIDFMALNIENITAYLGSRPIKRP
jgi:hypothetical protein